MRFALWALGVALLIAPRILSSQERGAIALGEAVQGLGVNTRVLVIGAHPDDEDTFLIAWLSRGRHVETAYLSLTRGDGGQNLIGNELGEALGVIRTEELLAARRVDGARQFFTRAYDFGFSKDTIDTYRHWPRDSVLADVVRTVRIFRPHVIVAVFSGTPRDGHGHHQASGLLAREAFDIAGDAARFRTAEALPPWTPLKFYRAARFNPQAGTLSVDVGEYSPLLGRSFAEIAGESRSQHKSQGFGVLQRRGQVLNFLRREASRVNESTPSVGEKSIFDGIDTTWARFRDIVVDPRARAALDSLPDAFRTAKQRYDAFRPAPLVQPLARAQRLLDIACARTSEDCSPTAPSAQLRLDFTMAFRVAHARIARAVTLASGLEFERVASREIVPVMADVPVVRTLYNRGGDSVLVVSYKSSLGPPEPSRSTPLAPGTVWRDTVTTRLTGPSSPRWLARPRWGAMFVDPGSGVSQSDWSNDLPFVTVTVGKNADTASILMSSLIWHRVADPVRGEVLRAVAAAPAIAVTLERDIQYVPAGMPLDRELAVHLRSADEKPRDVRVTPALPHGLTPDSSVRTVRLEGYDARQTIIFRLRGRLEPGEHRIAATAESDNAGFTTGYDLIDYDHIQRHRVYRPAATKIVAVDVRVPTKLRVGYVTGVGDNVAPMLAQLGIPVTGIPAAEFARADLRSYTTIVIGPRAYEAHPQLAAANTRLLDFALRGGTVVVQYGQYEMTQPGIMPYPITLARPADRVTEEDSPVTIEAPNEKELRFPNRIDASDFAGWVQERALYMPRTFDPRYRTLLSMHDTGEPPNRGAVLVAPLGDGVYVYTTISFFRQLPAGVPGGARLFVNLLSAGISSPRINP